MTYDYKCSKCRDSVRLWCALPKGHQPLCYDCEQKDLKRHREAITKVKGDEMTLAERMTEEEK